MCVDAPRQSRLGTRSPIAVQLPDHLAEGRALGRDSRDRSETVQRVVTVAAANGLHMRICAAVASAASRFEADVRVQIDDRVESAASILGLMLLGAMQGEQLLLSATGPDASEALRTLAELLGQPALDNIL